MLDKSIPKCYYTIRKREEQNLKKEKERFKMTKKEMIDYIEASGMVINFSRSYFNKMLRARVEEFYNDAVRFCNK